jgi:hypothetical protein
MDPFMMTLHTSNLSIMALKRATLATRHDIAQWRKATQQDMAELRKATQQDTAELRKVTQQDMAELRKVTQQDTAELRKDVSEMRKEMATKRDLENFKQEIFEGVRVINENLLHDFRGAFSDRTEWLKDKVQVHDQEIGRIKHFLQLR